MMTYTKRRKYSRNHLLGIKCPGGWVKCMRDQVAEGSSGRGIKCQRDQLSGGQGSWNLFNRILTKHPFVLESLSFPTPVHTNNVGIYNYLFYFLTSWNNFHPISPFSHTLWNVFLDDILSNASTA